MKTHIVLPLGVGAEGTPVQKYLEQSVASILDQTDKNVLLTVAADKNIPERCVNFLVKNNIRIQWFEEYSYFRPGSIWKKIFDSWKTIDSNYVGFLHYDDLWDRNKLKIQVDLLEQNNLFGAWSEVYTIDENSQITSSDLSFKSLSIDTVGRKFCAFCHSTIVDKQALFSSGILNHENTWGGNFEKLLAVYLHKIKKVQKAEGAKFYWRNHTSNITHTLQENKEVTVTQRKVTGYTFSQTLVDIESTKLPDLIQEVRALYK